MRIKQFDVVELKSGNKATILDKKNNKQYMAEIVNSYGITLEKRLIKSDAIQKVVHKRNNIIKDLWLT